jgi:hypothetical protein
MSLELHLKQITSRISVLYVCKLFYFFSLVWNGDILAAASYPAPQHRGAALLSGGRRLLEHAHARLAQEVHLQGNKEIFW